MEKQVGSVWQEYKVSHGDKDEKIAGPPVLKNNVRECKFRWRAGHGLLILQITVG